MEKNTILYGVNFENKIKKYKNFNKSFFHVVSDFDGTLTYMKNKKTNKITPSIISVLYNEGYLSDDYSTNAKKLENIYKPIEMDESLGLEEKQEKMIEWRKRHNELLIKSGLNKHHIDSIIDSDLIQLRNNCNKFFKILHNLNIPIIIFSASGLGTYAISSYLEKSGINYDNIHIVSNDFIWNDNGDAISRKEPFITSLNKDETLISNRIFPEVYDNIKEKKNIILLGNSLGDISMAKDSNNNLVIRIGFLAEENIKYLEKFKENFDIVLIGDGGMDEIMDIFFVNYIN